MGVNVLPGLPGAAASAIAQTGSAAPATANTAISGDFATLLSGELQTLLGLASADSGKGLISNTQEIKADPANLAEDTLANNGIDPALIAALTGNPAVQPEIAAPRDVAAPQMAANDIPANTVNTKSALLSQFSSTRNPASDPTSLQSASPGTRNEAANIAAEAGTGNIAWNNSLALAAGSQQVRDLPPTASHQTSVAPHIQTPAWSQHFGEKIVWLARNDQTSAQINLNPPQLGPVQITLNLSGDQASLAFASPHAEVRQAIESAMPQLKEMLASAGINLGQSSVGANLNQNPPENPFQSANGTRLTGENAILPANEKEALVGPSQALQRGRGLVDLFA